MTVWVVTLFRKGIIRLEVHGHKWEDYDILSTLYLICDYFGILQKSIFPFSIYYKTTKLISLVNVPGFFWISNWNLIYYKCIMEKENNLLEYDNLFFLEILVLATFLFLWRISFFDISVLMQGGRWECHCKYIEENWFGYFESMKFTDRCILAVVALSDCQEVMAAKIHLLVNWMQRK